eukprot:4176702-Heterocapsa_arctica.AAC.1
MADASLLLKPLCGDDDYHIPALQRLWWKPGRRDRRHATTSKRDVAQQSRRPRLAPHGSCKRRLGRGRQPASPRI